MPVSTPEVLFVLPPVAQTVGGIHSVFDVCNLLTQAGLKSACAIVGGPESGLANYREPLRFETYHFSSERDFLLNAPFKPRLVVATYYATALPAFVFARLRGIRLNYLVQGYEGYFEGCIYEEVRDSYALADAFVVISDWLAKKVGAHAPGKPLAILPLGADPAVFKPAPGRARGSKLRVAFVLRDAPGKGQGLLREILRELWPHRDKFSVTLVLGKDGLPPRDWATQNDFVLARMPLSRAQMAACLQLCDVLVDASWHEGFGLLPLEAMACGATVVAAFSGGVGHYLKDGINGLEIAAVNRPEHYVKALLSLGSDRACLQRFQAEAVKTAAQFQAPVCYARFVDFFRTELGLQHSPGERAAELAAAAREFGPATKSRFDSYFDLFARHPDLHPLLSGHPRQFQTRPLYSVYQKFKFLLPSPLRGALYRITQRGTGQKSDGVSGPPGL